VTWVKLSDDFAERAARSGLSDAAFRTHVEALLWTMRRETGGWIRMRDIKRFAETKDPEAAARQLVGLGWWDYPVGDDRYPGDYEPDQFKIVAGMDDQPEPDVIEARRRKTADRVRRHRRKMAGLDPDDPPPSNGVTERVTRVGSGRVLRTLPTLVKDQDQNQGQNHVGGQHRVGDPIADKTGPGLDRSAANSHNPRVHHGSQDPSSDDQQSRIPVTLQSQAADRNARDPFMFGPEHDDPDSEWPRNLGGAP
jgi:hypothetical protein